MFLLFDTNKSHDLIQNCTTLDSCSLFFCPKFSRDYYTRVLSTRLGDPYWKTGGQQSSITPDTKPAYLAGFYFDGKAESELARELVRNWVKFRSGLPRSRVPSWQVLGAQDISWGHTWTSDKVDVVRTKREHYSYKVVVVLAKLTLFVQSVNIIRTKLSLSLQS